MTPPPAPDLPSSWSDEDREATRPKRRIWLWVAIVVVLGLAGVLIAVVVRNGNPLDPEERAWPRSVGGRPAGLGADNETADEVTPTAKPGVYVWNSFDGWHVWVVNGDGVAGVKGTIRSDDGIDRARISAKDQGSVSLGDDTATFTLSADAAVTGVDFEPEFFTKRLTVTITDLDGKALSPSLVTLGTDTRVTKLPIVIDKPVVTDSGTDADSGS